MRQTHWTPEAERVLIAGCAELGIPITSHQVAILAKYANMLFEANTQFNLTAVAGPTDVASKHFVDSLAAFRICDFADDPHVVDIGTGAGLPGIPLKVLLPHIRFSFVEATRKKLEFVRHVCGCLKLPRCEFRWGRAEELAHTALRESFDVALVRAVGHLSMICELSLPFLRISGKLIAFKGPEVDGEFSPAQVACNILGGRIDKVDRFNLPLTESCRTLVSVVKEHSTDDHYPRKAAQIQRSLLGLRAGRERRH